MLRKRFPVERPLRDYVIQLSVVIVGVAVTFLGSELIDSLTRRNRLKATMRVVLIELQDNRNQLQLLRGKLGYERRAMYVIRENDLDPERIPRDSLLFYRETLFTLRHFQPATDALDLLKATGLLSQTNDQQLLFYILGSYNRLQGIHETVELYSARKLLAINHLFENNPALNRIDRDIVDVWQSYIEDPVCLAFITNSINFFGYGPYFQEQAQWLNETIGLLEHKFAMK